jgi:hypothetical protein
MKLSSLLRFFLISVVTSPLTSFLIQGHELDRHACTNETLRGEFGFVAHGTTLPALGLPPLLTGAFVSSGPATFDGSGHFTLTATSSFQGVIQGPSTVTGTYAVNSDCSYTSQASNGVTFRAVIVDGGREIFILQTTPGVVITGIAKKRGAERDRTGDDDSGDRPRACSAAHFAGAYGFLADGSAGAPTLPNTPFGPLAGVGVINVKPDGTFTAVAQRSVGGVLDPAPLPLTGSYSLSSDCSVQLTFDVGFHFDGTIISNSETVFVETDPGTALTVISKRL